VAKKSYVEQGKMAPESDEERLDMSSILGKRITAIQFNHAKGMVEFYSGRHKLLFTCDGSSLYDHLGNEFYDDLDEQGRKYVDPYSS